MTEENLGNLRKDENGEWRRLDGSRVESSEAGASAQTTDGAGLPSAPRRRRVSQQKQNRHLRGRQEYRGGGYLDTMDDAQTVLDAFDSGEATLLGETAHGFPVIRVDTVTGYNENRGAGYSAQPTHVFMIKGERRLSVVPMSPEWRSTGD